MESGFAEEQKKFGERIVFLRKEVFGLTQERFAELCGIQRTELSRIENGKKNFEFLTLVKLGNGFALELVNLFDYENKLPLIKRRRGDILKRAFAERIALGKRIIEIRKRKQKLQLELEVEINIWSSDISRIENAQLNMKFFSLFRIGTVGLKEPLIELFNYTTLPSKSLPKNK